MSVKHVVLRSTSGGGLEGRPTAGPATLAPKLSVDVQLETLQRGEAAELERQKGVIGVAPVIPMRLIAPIDVAAVAAPAAGRLTAFPPTAAPVSVPLFGKARPVVLPSAGETTPLKPH